MKLLVLGDIHGQWADMRALDLVYQYLDCHKVDRIVQIGDWFDPTSMSHYEHGRHRFLAGRDIDTEAAPVIQQMETLRSLTDAPIDWLLGNHEAWLFQWLDQHPEVGKRLDLDRLFPLKRLGITPRDSYPTKTLQIGKAHFTHGCFTGNNHLKRHLMAFGKPIFYGHTHEMSQLSHRWSVTGKQSVAVNVGFLAKYDLHYLKTPPSNWQQGFCVVNFLPDGSFTHYLIPFSGYSFVCPCCEVRFGGTKRPSHARRRPVGAR